MTTPPKRTKMQRAPCESCAAVAFVDQCHGCGRSLCQSCVDVFDHFGAGLHGTGDPAEAVRSMRTDLERLRQAPGAMQIGAAVATIATRAAEAVWVSGEFLTPNGIGKIHLVVLDDVVFEGSIKPVLVARRQAKTGA